MSLFLFFFFKQKTAYEMRISDWSSDVCSSDLPSSGTSKFNVSEKGPEPIPVFPNIPVDPSNTMNAAAFACVEVVKAAAIIPTENNIFFMKASPIRKYEIFTALQMLDFPGAR